MIDGMPIIGAVSKDALKRANAILKISKSELIFTMAFGISIMIIAITFLALTFWVSINDGLDLGMQVGGKYLNLVAWPFVTFLLIIHFIKSNYQHKQTDVIFATDTNRFKESFKLIREEEKREKEAEEKERKRLIPAPCDCGRTLISSESQRLGKCSVCREIEKEKENQDAKV